MAPVPACLRLPLVSWLPASSVPSGARPPGKRRHLHAASSCGRWLKAKGASEARASGITWPCLGVCLLEDGLPGQPTLAPSPQPQWGGSRQPHPVIASVLAQRWDLGLCVGKHCTQAPPQLTVGSVPQAGARVVPPNVVECDVPSVRGLSAAPRVIWFWLRPCSPGWPVPSWHCVPGQHLQAAHLPCCVWAASWGGAGAGGGGHAWLQPSPAFQAQT